MSRNMDTDHAAAHVLSNVISTANSPHWYDEPDGKLLVLAIAGVGLALVGLAEHVRHIKEAVDHYVETHT